MKRFLLTALLLLFVTASFASEGSLSSRLFTLDTLGMKLAADGITPSSSPSFKATTQDPQSLNPGKALMLSAIMPGAGQYYAGHNLRAAAFFTVEVLAWTGVIYYWNQGQKKDREFKTYADDCFSERKYRDKEYELALNPQYGDSGAYHGTEPEWVEESWNDKIHYLPNQGFTHELPDYNDRNASRSHDQQYYEMIGKYIHQFGFGWADAYLDEGLLQDNPDTPYYDGRRLLSERYMDMRHESNLLLDYSSYAMQVAMLNHVAAALEASFSVRALKRQAKAQVGFRQIHYDGHPVVVGGLNFSW